MGESIEVGRVAGLWRYPVKSMASQELREADVSWHGVAGDRRWAFVREGRERSGFPWLTIRQRADMLGYRPWFVEPGQPDSSATMVRTPGGIDLDVVDPALAAELGDGARVIKQDRGVFDTMPLSLITTQTVAHLGERAGVELDVQRFRPNLLVAAASGSPFPEDDWVGSVLRIGDLRMRVDARDKRCVVVNVDPSTRQRSREVLQTITGEREARLGVYGSTVQPGRVAIGDPVVLDP